MSVTHQHHLPNGRYARHVGRVGALAVALGIGMAVASGPGIGISRADDPDQSDSTSASDGTGAAAHDSASPVDTGTPTSHEPTPSGATQGGDSNDRDSNDPTSPPVMNFSTSGGADTSTNDAGQHTDDATPAAPVSAPPPPPTVAATPPSTDPTPPPQSDSPPTRSRQAPNAPSTATGLDQTAGLEYSDYQTPSAPDDSVDTARGTATTTTVDDPAPAPRLRSVVADQTLVSALAAPQPRALTPPATDPIAGLLALPARVVSVTTTFVAALLAPFLAPGPATPAQPPLLWAVLAWVRQEVGRAFFNKPPGAVRDDVTTSEDTEVDIDVLANDTDAEDPHGALSVVGYTQPLHGSVELNADGTFTYTPDAAYTGPDSFTYTVSDEGAAPHVHGPLGLLFGGGHTSTGTVDVTVSAVTAPPVAEDDAVETDEDNPVSGNVLTNDSPGKVGPLTAALADAAAHGTAVVNPDGTFTYTPATDFNGEDSFTYTVTEGALSATGTVYVTVAPVPDAPVAHDDDVTTNVGAPVTIAVLANDTDPDIGDTAIPVVTQRPLHGFTVVNFDGTITYTPDATYVGPDTFTYLVIDGAGLRDTATVSITVVKTNTAPVATDDDFSGAEDTTVTGNVFANDIDADGDGLSGEILTYDIPPGSIYTIAPDGALTFTPPTNFNGTVLLTYRVFDGTAYSDPATVTITITPAFDPQVAKDDAFSGPEGTPITGSLIANDDNPDGATLNVLITSLPAHGTLDFPTFGSFTYTPDPGYIGPDSFGYQLFDGTRVSNTATVTITVTPVDDPPVANPDAYTTAEDTTLDVSLAPDGVLGNDSDPEGHTLTVVDYTSSAHGTLTLNANGTFTYAPEADFNGQDGFTYTVTDGANHTEGSVTITVTPVNDPPVSVPDAYTIAEDGVLQGKVTRNDTDVDTADIWVVGGHTQPAHGTLDFLYDGSFTYTPDANLFGTDAFSYSAWDRESNGVGNEVLVTITVTPVDDPPVAVNDQYTVAEDTVLNGNVLDNDADPDDTLSAVLLSGVSHGTLTFVNGAFTYAAAPNYFGDDGFTYAVTGGVTTTAGVGITITPVNDPPVSIPDSFAVAVNGVLRGDVTDNDIDVDTADIWVVGGHTQPAHGTLDFLYDGSFTYTPDADFVGTDAFSYSAWDRESNGVGNEVLVTISVRAANRAPLTFNQNVTTLEDTPATDTLFIVELDGDQVTGPTLVVAPSHGQVSFQSHSGSLRFTYTPAANYNGSDSFTYTVGDGMLDSTPATVDISITPVVDPLLARGDAYSVTRNATVFGNILDNDVVEIANAHILIVSQPTNGQLTISESGAFSYAPNQNFTGTDGFSYRLYGGGQPETATASVVFTVLPGNNAPEANDQRSITNEDEVLTDTLSYGDADADPLTLAVVTQPAHGTVTFGTTAGAPSFTYTPAADFNGEDSFSYTVSDGALDSNIARVLITVNPVNDPPVAVADTFSVDESAVLRGNVIGNDTDADGTALNVASPGLVTTAHGAVTILADGSFTYTPIPGYNGPDSFTYRATDGVGTSVPATVSITVNSVYSPPIGVPDAFVASTPSGLLNKTVSGNVLSNDLSPDGRALTATLVTPPTKHNNGTFVLNPNGSFTYRASLSAGVDSFTYRISDGITTSGPIAVGIIISPI